MTFSQKEFERDNSRDKVQTLIDIDIFRKETTSEQILEYLEFPYDVILKKYDSCYEKSW